MAQPGDEYPVRRRTQITNSETGNNVSAENRYNFVCDNMESRESVWKLYRRKTKNAESEIGPNLTDVKPPFLPTDCRLKQINDRSRPRRF
jgi:hypothetical protein